MALTSVFIVLIIAFSFSTLNNCLSMVIPSSSSITNDTISNLTKSPPTHILRVRIRVHNSLIETLVNKKQLDLIEVQLNQRKIPNRQIQDNKDGITIIIGPFHKSINVTAIMMMLNQSRFHTNFTKILPIKTDFKNQTIVLNNKKIHSEHLPLTVEAHEYDLAHDQESYEFRNCLEACEVYEENELKPDHDCIRRKCLKDITGI